MEKFTDKKQINRLAILFALTYMVSYITRINYGAIISEMESDTAFARSLLSIALTGSFVTYGVGQVISGIIGDRISPKKLVSIGFCITIVMNILIPFCQTPYQMAAIWCINGFAQSLMWPPIVRLMSTLLTEDDYKAVVTKVSWGSNLGTVAVYLFSPLCISAFGWRFVFWLSAFCGCVMLFFWHRNSYEIGIVKREKTVVQTTEKLPSLFSPMMLVVMLAIVLQGMLRDGITTWMPTYISETYQMSNIISILTGVILPIFSILTFQFASKLYIKKFTNPMVCAGVFFAGGTVFAILLYLLNGVGAAYSVVLSALLTGCMHAVNLILICMVPNFFEKSGKVSTVSGVLNSCTYIGSALSTYGIALLSERIGWQYTILVWFAIAFAGSLCCLLCAKPWKKKMMS